MLYPLRLGSSAVSASGVTHINIVVCHQTCTPILILSPFRTSLTPILILLSVVLL